MYDLLNVDCFTSSEKYFTSKCWIMKNWGNLSETMEFLILQGTRGEKYFGRHCSEKKYPPLKKTSVDDDLQQVIEERWRKLCFEDGIIKIPDSVEMTVSWEKAFHSFPDTRIKVGRFFKSLLSNIWKLYLTTLFFHRKLSEITCLIGSFTLSQHLKKSQSHLANIYCHTSPGWF